MTDTLPNYPPPIDTLLTRGEPASWGTDDKKWPDYLELGLGPEHVPDLVRLATDEALHAADGEDPAVWAPLHAWRALGQLRAEDAVGPLLGLLKRIDDLDDDSVGEELPLVFGRIGPAAIPALEAYVADTSHGLYARTAAGRGLAEIGRRNPEARDAIVAALTRRLEAFEQNDEGLNGFLIADLLELGAVEAAPLIERAFAGGRVDLAITGDWEDAQIELGLKTERETPRPDLFAGLRPPGLLDADEELEERPVPEAIRAWNEAVRARKQAAEITRVERMAKKKRKRGRGKKGGG